MPATRQSRYEFASIHQDEESRLYFDAPEPLSKDRDISDDTLYVVKEGDTIFNLAFRFYREMLVTDPTREVRPSKFYWVIAQTNDIIDPTVPLEAGKQLIIPGVRVLNNEILTPPPYIIRDRFVSS